MRNEWLCNLSITDKDIDWAEESLGNDIHFDSERRAAIRAMRSVDIQAFPGTGKTTALIAKLAILSKKWPSAYTGMCVLSHTNAAREEIEERLGSNEYGAKLLRYPHFIGTLHSFFTRYIAIPWLRSHNRAINLIDTERAKQRRWQSLDENTKLYFKHNNKDSSICCYVNCIGEIGWKKGGETRDKLIAAINKSHDAGVFTYDEMLLFAKQAIEEVPQIAIAIQNRFPLLLIDEAQDTNNLQWNLLKRTFLPDSSGIIMQAFGDKNQAIYSFLGDEECNEFPHSDALSICTSRRFDERIARLANIAALSREQMNGTPNEFSRQDFPINHTIFLFQRNRDSAQKVITAYAQLILDSFSDAELLLNQSKGCHVVGAVHIKHEETKEKHFPKGIYDYWPQYNSEITSSNAFSNRFITYYRRAIREFNTSHEVSQYMHELALGLRRLVNNAVSKNLIPFSGQPYHSLLYPLSHEEKSKLKKILQEIFLMPYANNKEQWKKICQELQKVILLYRGSSNDYVESFLQWETETPDAGAGESLSTKSQAIYIYQDPRTGRSVHLEFGSIHSVKGKTHLSTLVLETYNRSHQIKSIICSKSSKGKSISTRQAYCLKLLYVAMTRAKALLCLAIPQEFVGEQDKAKLRELGWSIQNID